MTILILKFKLVITQNSINRFLSYPIPKAIVEEWEKVIKISDSTSLKLKELMKAIEGTCSPEESMKARKIFKIYFDRAEIVE